MSLYKRENRNQSAVISAAQNHRPWEGFDLDSRIFLQRGGEVAGENSILSGQNTAPHRSWIMISNALETRVVTV